MVLAFPLAAKPPIKRRTQIGPPTTEPARNIEEADATGNFPQHWVWLSNWAKETTLKMPLFQDASRPLIAGRRLT